MTTLGQRIRAAREEAGLTQEDVARAIGVTAQTPSRWERDTSVPRVRQLRALAGLFEKPADHFQEAAVASPDSFTLQDLARVFADALQGQKRENAATYADRRQRHEPVAQDRRQRVMA